mmetsp:Transcript_40386/g.107005  ORF Transcript_40386/g.107005 Transcript_40386/m.107005 type:complete len:250 (-) Transcript_40386:316-1065(-)
MAPRKRRRRRGAGDGCHLGPFLRRDTRGGRTAHCRSSGTHNVFRADTGWYFVDRHPMHQGCGRLSLRCHVCAGAQHTWRHVRSPTCWHAHHRHRHHLHIRLHIRLHICLHIRLHIHPHMHFTICVRLYLRLLRPPRQPDGRPGAQWPSGGALLPRRVWRDAGLHCPGFVPRRLLLSHASHTEHGQLGATDRFRHHLSRCAADHVQPAARAALSTQIWLARAHHAHMWLLLAACRCRRPARECRPGRGAR